MAVTSAIAAVAAVGHSVYQGEKMRKAQKKAAGTAARQAELAQRQSEREFNRLNQKTPNIAATMQRNRTAGGVGVSGTYLTGAAGAPVTTGMLGRTAKLGA